MLDRQLLRTDPDLVRSGASRKGIEVDVESYLRLDEEYRALLTDLQAKQAQSNQDSKAIGQLMAAGNAVAAEAAKASMKDLKAAIATGEERQRELEAKLQAMELQFPNLPHESVPDGFSEEKNQIIRDWGDIPQFDFEPKPHWDLAENLGLVDFPRASKISGSGFAVYTGWGARLQRALITFMIDHQTMQNGYAEVYPPYLVNAASLVGTGQLPKFEEDLYKADEDLYLIPTAEVPVTNLHRDEILEVYQLPMRFAAYSGCFRKEAGAAGKDTRGLLRMHQFDKVELVKYTLPENSYDELETLLSDAESILRLLGLHYRVTLLCAGEMSFSNAKCYDLEVWSPGVGRYLEISSCSNFEAFQARRANIRFRRAQGEKPEFVHILNGSGLATPRLFAAVLETYQQPDGTVVVPEPLRPLIGSDLFER
ncbi:MAG TPA: serine--tRNA ligase [Fimbriimonadaceae bacterium]|nr:serine--tRNA ligase [Fimbriimonadaceae bacterium]HRJ95819.1 serine--tRNA ligase [Fimbriimonadaceae bacterium]